MDLISEDNSPKENDPIETKNIEVQTKDIGVQIENSEIENSIEVIEKGLKVKPNMHIDLTNISYEINNNEITSNSILDSLPENFDPLLIENYIPFPDWGLLTDLGYAASLGAF